MAIETSTTDRSAPTDGKKTGVPTKQRRTTRRKPNTTAPKATGSQPAVAVQVELAEVATAALPGPPVSVQSRRADGQPGARRSGVRRSTRARKGDKELPVGETSSPGAIAQSGGAASPKQAESKRARGRGRQPVRSRRAKDQGDAAAAPVESAGAIGRPDGALAPGQPDGDIAAMMPDRAWDEPALAAEVEDRIDRDSEDGFGLPLVVVEEREADDEIITVEPDDREETSEAPIPSERPGDDEPRRRRRGRRGRRGGRKGSGQDGGAAAAEAAPVRPAGPRAGHKEAVADDEPPELEEGDDELPESDLAITPFTSRDPRAKAPPGREMIINVSAGFECRVAILHEARLEELFIEREATQSHVGNIYKGRVTNVEPSIQAAFVDFGLEKNGFLHVSDVQPQYFPNHVGGAEDVGRKIPRHQRPPIQKCFRRGQEVIVQITKEGVGTKGPTLTSYLSIPGRYLVMMPGMSHTGVSRKIEDEAARRRMRDVLSQLILPKGIGFILRTAGLDRPKRELQRDLNYLLRLWKTVVERIKSQRAPAELYRESDLVSRTLRDVYTSDFSRIVVDDANTARQVREFVRIAMPRTKVPIEHYSDREPLFHRLGIEAEIEKINMRHVPLRSGGSLVIDSTEAMVTIDVNSGRFRTPDDAEETALRINLEAAEEIARQLRLRDLGGLIVCDFIDMRHERNKRKVEQALREALKRHKERARILRMSAFGLIEMTRQRQGPSIRRNMYHDCPHCRGSGQVKLPESVILDAMRTLQLAAHQGHVHKIAMALAPDVAFALLNRKRGVIHLIESETGKKIAIIGRPEFTSDQMEIHCEDNRGREVTIGGGAAD